MKMSSLSSSTRYALLAAALSTLESALGLWIEKDFNPDQPRDEAGRVTSGGGGDSGSAEEGRQIGPIPIERRETLIQETIAKLDLSGEVTYRVMPPGKEYPIIVDGETIGIAAADYNPETGEIRLFNGAFYS